jgi:hypothetical protein
LFSIDYADAQVRLAGRQLVTKVRISELVGDHSWKPGVPRKVDNGEAASRWKMTVAEKVGGGATRSRADAMLKKLLNRK